MTVAGVGAAGRIRVLPPAIADAIAAGEVVERPASVVKELVENALDAGAARVQVEIDAGGRERVRVGDDGGGMSGEDLRLAFARHATSKVMTLEDLTRIATLGFRGEALASIGAVARVEAVSRRREDQAGALVVVAASTVEGPTPAAAPVGTAMTVTQLFATTPARRAFLRPPRTEGLACAQVVADLALATPRVVFELVGDGRRVLRTPGSGDLVDAVRAVFGTAAARACRPVRERGGDFEVVGVLGGPEVARASRSALVLFVNGRRVQQRSLQVAVETAYRGLLEVGRHPLAVLDLRCDPGVVDVNVHPTKREVRFRDERAAFAALERACWATLRGSGAPPVWSGPVPAPRPGDAPAIPAAISACARDPRWPGPAVHPVLDSTPWASGFAAPPVAEGGRPGASLPLADAAGWRLVGQLHRQYLVAETAEGMALVDQHAAHERVLYRRLLERLRPSAVAPGPGPGGEGGHDRAAAQGWLIPELVELPAPLVAGLATAAPVLRRVGIVLEPFGPTTVRCTASPAGMRPARVGDVVAELVEEALCERPDGGAMRAHRLAALVACHTAVRFGDPMAPAAADRLLRDLAATPLSLTCPHGRPTVIRLGDVDLRRAFHRPPA